VFVPAYRLAPEHPYPAALHDAVAAFEHVRALRPDAPIVVAGDSAGGGLVLSLSWALRERGRPLPAAAVALSPWTDLATTGASVRDNDRRDVWLSRRHLEQWGRHYVGDADPTDPGLSPIHADPSGWPPLLLLAGDREVLLDDTLRVEAAARAAGVDVEVCIGRDMQHDWPLTMPWLDEAREAWKRIRTFLDRHAAAVDRGPGPEARSEKVNASPS
ncbi:MAG: alpha/beta hydrolase fold domain-containing protein, partial [Myxococcota bacterium]